MLFRSTQATEAREDALAKFEASLQSKIYQVTAAERQIFRAHLKNELELSRIWIARDRALVEQEHDQSVFAATKTRRRQFEELYHDAQDRLDSQQHAGASCRPQGLLLLQHFKTCGSMGSHLETNKTTPNRPSNSLHHPPTSSGPRLLQIRPYMTTQL